MTAIPSEAREVFLQRLTSSLNATLSKLEDSVGIKVKFVPLTSSNLNAYPPEISSLLSKLKQEFALSNARYFSRSSEEREDRYDWYLHHVMASVLGNEEGERADDLIPFLFWASLGEGRENTLVSYGSFHYNYIPESEFFCEGYYPRVYLEAPPTDLTSTSFFEERLTEDEVRRSPDRARSYLRYFDKTSQIVWTLYQSGLALRKFALFLLEDTLLSMGESPDLAEANSHLFPLVFVSNLPNSFKKEEKTDTLLQNARSFAHQLSDELRFLISTTELSKIKNQSIPLLPIEVLEMIPRDLMNGSLETHIEISDKGAEYPNIFADFKSFAVPLLIEGNHSRSWSFSAYDTMVRSMEALSGFRSYNFTVRSERDPFVVGRTIALLRVSDEYRCSFVREIEEAQSQIREKWSHLRWSKENSSWSRGWFERSTNILKRSLYESSYGTDLKFNFLRADIHTVEEEETYSSLRFLARIPVPIQEQTPWSKIGHGLLNSLEISSPSYTSWMDDRYRPYEWALLLDRESLGVSLILLASHYFIIPLYMHACLLPKAAHTINEISGFNNTVSLEYVKERPKYPSFQITLHSAKTLFSIADDGNIGPKAQSVLDQYQRVYELLAPSDYFFPLFNFRTVFTTQEICEEIENPIFIPTLQVFVFANEGALKRAGEELKVLLELSHDLLSRFGALVEIEARLQKLP